MASITPELIPHSRFHTGTWLVPVNNRRWYYFMKKRNGHVIRNKTFLESVDGPLRALVDWLHHMHISTTPSCSGHHLNKQEMGKIYDSLESSSEIIREKGLVMKDIESGKKYFVKSRKYRLPWSRQRFLKLLSSYQKKGVLGIRLGSKARQVEAMMKKLQNASMSFRRKGSYLFVYVEAATSKGTMNAWRKITKSLKSVLGEAGITGKKKSRSPVDRGSDEVICFPFVRIT